jgi:parvulin-like peptidyl-prolyl isomerase
MKSAMIPILALLLSCGRSPSVEAGRIASAGERKFTLAAFEEFLVQQVGREPYYSSPQVLSALLDTYVKEAVLEQEARRKGLGGSSQPEAIQRLLKEVCGRLPDPGEAQVRACFDRTEKDYATPVQYVFREIFMTSAGNASDVYAKARAGRDFAELAKAHSETANKDWGGRVGPVSLEDIPDEIALALKNLRPGQVSPLLPVSGGSMILKLERVLPPAHPGYAEVQDLIRVHLREEACQQAKETLEKDLILKEHVWIYSENLPFAYSGELPLWPRRP